ncbi:MAG: hypothetical protein KatS3mg118_2302 [Paracoccaceae bacterium]|nr:MAG: hypothetical protein KatS3mg118_2302 [Paracoccaceae bacterium]
MSRATMPGVAALAEALAVFAPGLPVLHFPAWDCLPYDRISPNAAVAAARMATLAALARGFDRQAVILTTLNAVTQRVPAPDVVAGASFAARVGGRVDLDQLLAYLGRMGFNRAATVTEPGDYAIRGGIIDIFPPGVEHPVRLDLFGDVLDGARRFDAATQRTIEKIDRVELAPVSEVILDAAAIARFRQSYRETFGAVGLDDPLYEAVSAGRKHQGFEHWLPFFHERLVTLFDYLPGAPVALDDRLDAALAARAELVRDHYEARRAALNDKGMRGAVYKPCPPELMYLDAAGFASALEGRALRQFSPLPQPPGPGVIDAGVRIGRNFAPERADEKASLFDAVAAHVRDCLRRGRVVLAAYSEGARERLGHILADHGVEGARPVRRWSEMEPRGLYLLVWGLEAGFVIPPRDGAPETTVIAEQDILGDRLIRAPRRRRRAENVLTEAASLAPATRGRPCRSRHRPLSRACRRSPPPARPMNAWRSQYAEARPAVSCRSRTSSCCRASATRRPSSTGWAAGPGRRARPVPASASRRWPSG